MKWYQDWAKYEIAILRDKRKNNGSSSLKDSRSSMTPGVMAAIFHLTSCGLGDTADLGTAYGPATNRFCKQPLGQAIQSRVSRVDTALAQFSLGWLLQKRKSLAEAKQCYTDLFDGDSYLAPQGGLGLANCQRAEGKPEDAKETLKTVARRFPSHKEQARALYDEWFKSPGKER